MPAVAVFAWERIQRDSDGKIANQFLVAPDWTVEILSPCQSKTKVMRNILHCLEHGAQMGWLIDPDEELIFVYRDDRTVTIFEQAKDVIPVPAFADAIQLSVGQVFGWLED